MDFFFSMFYSSQFYKTQNSYLKCTRFVRASDNIQRWLTGRLSRKAVNILKIKDPAFANCNDSFPGGCHCVFVMSIRNEKALQLFLLRLNKLTPGKKASGDYVIPRIRIFFRIRPIPHILIKQEACSKDACEERSKTEITNKRMYFKNLS